MCRNYLVCAVACAAFLMVGCRSSQPAGDPMVSVNTLHLAPADFAARRAGTDEWPIPPYAKFLAGVKICLDPGHGGQADNRGYKRGPTGVREAEMNLRIAQYLREFLLAAGADVRLTREEDVDLSLADRAGLANDWAADIFVSMHHNAIDNKPQVNFTTVWYHGDVDHHPSSLDLARYLCDGLYDALALPQITDVPLKSDQLMYKGGFAVLRHAEVTAALCESSFFTNPDEEQRLREPEYNLLEAYGLFIGLAKYAAAGLPRATLIDPTDGVLTAGQSQLRFELDDGLRGRKAWGSNRTMIVASTIATRVDGVDVPAEFVDDGEHYSLMVNLPPDLAAGDHDVDVQFQNMYKNSVLNPHFTIHIAP